MTCGFLFKKDSRGKSFPKLNSIWSQSWMIPSTGRSEVLAHVSLLCLTLNCWCTSLYKVTCSLYLSKHVIYMLWLFFFVFFIMTKGGSILSGGLKYTLNSCEGKFDQSNYISTCFLLQPPWYIRSHHQKGG